MLLISILKYTCISMKKNDRPMTKTFGRQQNVKHLEIIYIFVTVFNVRGDL